MKLELELDARNSDGDDSDGDGNVHGRPEKKSTAKVLWGSPTKKNWFLN
jgi:hypothetical protein